MDNTRLDYDRNLFESVYAKIAWGKNLPIFQKIAKTKKFYNFPSYNGFIDV